MRPEVESHHGHSAPATLLAAELEDPAGYGRVVLDREARVASIVEERDADDAVRAIKLVNTGVYCFRWPEAAPFLDRLSPDNAQGERYLTDVMVMLRDAQTPARMVHTADAIELTGINDRVQLAFAEGILRDRIRRRLMRNGVTFLSPDTTLVDADVEIGPDTVLYPGVLIEGACSIGGEVVIGPFSRIVDAHIGRGAELQGWNYVARTTVANGAILAPYLHQGAV